MKIYCLMSGYCLSDSDRNVLMFAAVQMVRDKNPRKSLKGENFEGVITTDFSGADLGGIGGTRFKAEIETDVGTRSIEYLVRTRDLEGIEKAQWCTIEDLLRRLEPSQPCALN